MIDSNSFSGASVGEICKVFELFIAEKVKNDISKKPIIFVLEDIHWIDEKTVELLFEFLKMIRILKKQLKFNFIFLVTERSSEHEPRIGHKRFDEMFTQLKSEQFYNFHQLYVSKIKDKSFLVKENFCERFLSNCGVDFSYRSIKKISESFSFIDFYNPGHILESLQYIVSNNWIEERNGLLEIKKEADFKNVPLPSQLKEVFAEKFSTLDVQLQQILEAAAFIGESFEANIISEIWKIDRLVLLHKLRTAEQLGFVKDVSDKDDVYIFTSKGIIAELRNHASRGNDDIRPQLVKEYHKMITDVMLNKKQIDPNTFDINIVSQLADRTFYNRDQMPNEAYKLNLITAKRLLNKVNVKQAKEYILRLKILSSDSAISLQQKISTAILQQKLSLITLTGKTFEDSILESEKLDEVFDMINISDFASSYEEFYLDKLQLYFNCLPYYNEPNFKIKKQQHLNAIEKICSDSNPKLLTKDIEFASKFYYVTFSLDTNKKKDDLEVKSHG